MHRVLSYQTAMRASTSRDIREYVTKRTCVSLILSIAFFTFIAGFLLGKFVSDRQHHMKHQQNAFNNIDDYVQIKDAKLELIKTAQNFTRILQDTDSLDSSSQITVKKFIYEKYISCLKTDTPKHNNNVPIDQFLEDFLNDQAFKQLKCLNSLKDYINNL